MIEIKQYAPKNALVLSPRGGRVYLVGQNIDNTFITGLSEEQEKRLGKTLGKDLAPDSNFWREYTIEFKMPKLSMRVDENSPFGELFISVAKANKLLAEDEEQIRTNPEYKKNTIFYIHDTVKIEEKKVKFNVLKDEVSALLIGMRNDKDKMLFIAYKLGRAVAQTLKADNLYNILSAEKEKFTKLEQLNSFKQLLKTSNEELQAYYYVKAGIRLNIIVIDSDTKQYKFQDKAVGESEAKVIKYFSDKKNELSLVSLINEINDYTQ